MTQEVAENNLEKWFWMFKHKLVDEYPEYSGNFDYVVGSADSKGVLYECMEFANRFLEVESELKGGIDNLFIRDYVDAIDYGYTEWVNNS